MGKIKSFFTIIISGINACICFALPYFMFELEFPFGSLGASSKPIGDCLLILVGAIFLTMPLLAATCAVLNEIIWFILVILRIEKETAPQKSELFDSLLTTGLTLGAVAGGIFMLLMGIGCFI